MNLGKALVCTGIFLFGITTWAVDPRGRIDICGEKNTLIAPGISPEGGSLSNPNGQIVYSQGNALIDEKWENYKFSFIPQTDGAVYILLKAIYFVKEGEEKSTSIWVRWDDVNVDGASLVNGDFEKADINGKLEGWNTNPHNYIDEEGNKCVRVCHDSYAVQRIAVTKGREVTITAKVKRDKTEGR